MIRPPVSSGSLAKHAKECGFVDIVAASYHQAMSVVAKAWYELRTVGWAPGFSSNKESIVAYMRRTIWRPPPDHLPKVKHKAADSGLDAQAAGGCHRSADEEQQGFEPPLSLESKRPDDGQNASAAWRGSLMKPLNFEKAEAWIDMDSTGCSVSDSGYVTETRSSNSREHDGKSYMLCNIPCRLKMAELRQAIDSLGFAGEYEYIHVPTGGHSRKKTSTSLGYGFIKFFEVQTAEVFAQAFEGFVFARSLSKKKCTVKAAYAELSQSQLHEARSCMKFFHWGAV
eukprot:TRINITY_DN60194_c0_g1_i1.p1 TRINITY_DN60194_c0_g1~~TRINITY_DN60194_c0_g1_i1.p1  ORF type:complete len:284 (+),score=67.60 TRINITY_DN60194_c0_g1_i1:141-992(+)